MNPDPSGPPPDDRRGYNAPVMRHLISLILGVMVLGLTVMGQEPGTASAPSTSPATGGVGPAMQMPSGANVAIIRIEGTIYGFTQQSLERRVERALDGGASVIVLELDTPGGTLTSALDISKYIKTLPVPTIAWINNDAYSAGIIIGSACDRIVMSPASATGDAAPISLFGNLAPTERAKVLSPILEEFRDNATSNGYDFAAFHAMTVLGVEVYQIRNPDTGEIRLVNQKDYAVMVGGESIDAASPTSSSSGDSDEETNVGAPAVRLATAADRGRWELVQKVHDGNTLLTLNQTRALDVGLSEATIANESDLQQWLGANAIVTVPQTWSENLAGYVYFLTLPLAKGVLMVVLMVGIYIELQSPGFGVGGAVAALALLLLLGAPLVVGLAEVWHILAFVLGLGMLALELAFLPGFGLLGVAGLVLMFVGLVFAGIPTGGGGQYGPVNLPPREMWSQVTASTIAMLLGIIASFVAFYFLANHFGRLPLLGRLVLETEPPGPAAPMAEVSGDEVLGEGRIDVGATGRSVTELRPTGRAEFDGQAVDVVSVGSWIDPGRPVQVVEVHGNRIVVDNA